MTSGTILRIKWSKMLQQKEGLLLNPLPSIPRAMLCPLSTSQNYFCMAPTSSPTTPFFCLSATSGCCPLAATHFCASLNHLISHIGLHPEDYSPHSFRCRGTTFAFQASVPEHLIKLHGDRCSDAYQTYLTLPLATRSWVANIMATSMSSVIT